MITVVILAAQLALPAQADVDAARAAEEKAFAAIDEQRWCDAAHRFLDANDIAPSVDLIYNAAQAADYAGDRKLALRLYADLVGAYPGSDRQEAVNQRMVELTGEVTKSGAGTACPERTTPEAPAATLPDDAPDANPDTAAVTGEGAPADSDTSGGGGMSFLPWVGVGVSAVAVLAGGAMVAAGGGQALLHSYAKGQIENAQATGSDVPDGAHDLQSGARAAWQTWGEATFFAGIGTAVIATLLVGAAATWGVVDLVLAE